MRMKKSPNAFRSIGEVANWLDTEAYVLRFWESRFSHIKPIKRDDGRRYYRPEDMMIIGGIKTLLHKDGLTIKGVQKILREDGVKHVASLSPPIDNDNSQSSSETTSKELNNEPNISNQQKAKAPLPETEVTINSNTEALGSREEGSNTDQQSKNLNNIAERLRNLRNKIQSEI
jgi:DNA-binding transcriptional MerR regulator